MTTSSQDGVSLADVVRRRVVPVVVTDDPARADDLGAALVAGGLPVAEVTLRNPFALEVLGALAGRGDLLVGAGTVTTPEQVDRVHDAGAQFVVSPGLSVAVVGRCRARGLPVLPGVATASELMGALALGLGAVKFFPAEASGGPAAVSALAAAFGQVRFVPTGGISLERAPAYLAHPEVAAVGGSWMVAPDLLAAGAWDEVVRRCADAVQRLGDPVPAASGVR